MLNKLALVTIHEQHSRDTQYCNHVLDIVLDLIKGRLKRIQTRHKTPEQPPKMHLKVRFVNKGIEMVRLGKILKNERILTLIPPQFRDKRPRVLFNYEQPIGLKLFNYRKTIDNLDPSTTLTCQCRLSPYRDKHHGHIVTGDLSIISDTKLRELVRKGPNYRENIPIDWKYTYQHIHAGMKECTKRWAEKEKVDRHVLVAWRTEVMKLVSKRIKTLNKTSLKPIPPPLLSNEEILSSLSQLHRDYVLTPTDKASSNVAVICKKFYVERVMNELNLVENIEDQGNATYEPVHENTDTLIDNNCEEQAALFNINIEEDNKTLPFLYWIPKQHKNPSKQRYIAASKRCSTKQLSSIITKCLSLVDRQHQIYCRSILRYSKYNYYWVVPNSKTVLDTLNQYEGSARNVASYDFSTLYTSIPHQKLKDAMEWVVTKAFAGKGTKFISVYSSYAAWTTRPRKGTFAVNAIQLVRMIAYLIDHIYVTCGSFTFRQIIGIPMGTDCAPLLANLFLYSYEWRFMRQKTKEKQYDIAAKFNKTGRFIDDLFTLNNDLVMQEYMSHIYPPELLLNKENENDTHTTFLDLDISLTDNKITTLCMTKGTTFRSR